MTRSTTLLLLGLCIFIGLGTTPTYAQTAPIASAEFAPKEPAEAHSQLFVNGLSLGVTGAGALLVVCAALCDGKADTVAGNVSLVALMVGPSLGHAALGEWRKVGWGMGTRAVGGGLLMAVAAIGGGNGDGEPQIADDIIIWTSSAMLLGGALYELIDTPFSVARANKEARETKLAIVPGPIVGPTSQGLGANLSFRF